MNTETKTLTATQSALLAKIAAAPRSSSRTMHTGTVVALQARGLVKMVDRFPSGTALYSVTFAGRSYLRSAK